MTYPDINDYGRRKNDDYSKTYIVSIIIGILIFVIIYFTLKFFGFLIRFIIKHWIWIVVGIGVLILLKKFFTKKKVVLEKR